MCLCYMKTLFMNTSNPTGIQVHTTIYGEDMDSKHLVPIWN